jgi:hypothetical protein
MRHREGAWRSLVAAGVIIRRAAELTSGTMGWFLVSNALHFVCCGKTDWAAA